MKTFRNVVAVLGLLLFLYVGAYWRFAREELSAGYLHSGRSHSSDIAWSDWHKIFVPIASVDYRMNVERPFRKRHVGHWQAADSKDFVTLSRDGQCSFRIGEFQHAGKMEIGSAGTFRMVFARNGNPHHVSFFASEEHGNLTGRASIVECGTAYNSLPTTERAEATLTRASSPD